MIRRDFIKLAVATTVSVGCSTIATSLNSSEPVVEIRNVGMTHHMIGPHFQFIQEENGEMFCRDMCDCGCIDKKWKINKGDTIIAFRPALTGNLKELTIIAREFKFYRTTTLTSCRLFSRDFEKYPL